MTASAAQSLRLLHPLTGEALEADTPHSLAGGGTRFPVVEGIPYLRPGRDGLRADALAALDAGRAEEALARLLTDRDDHASGPPPGREAVHRLASRGAPTLRAAMSDLGYGPVGDYFAHRWSAPTFLSGLGLLASHWREGLPIVEIACGIGQLLREAQAADAEVVGVDVVFSKLWLAKRFILERPARLVCADAAHGLPLSLAGDACLLCHDALYFFDAKRLAIAAMRRLAGWRGALLIGHVHNRLVDQRGVGGTPLSPDEWAALLPDAVSYDDSTLANAWVARRRPEPTAIGGLRGAEALSFAIGPLNERLAPIGAARAGRPLALNPMLRAGPDGSCVFDWPSESLTREYADAGYLAPVSAPAEDVVETARQGTATEAVEDLLRRRVLIDLPEAW